MPRFFVPATAVAGGRAVVDGPDAVHLSRSLRVRTGELVVVVDDTGLEHGVEVDAVGSASVAGVVRWTRPATGEPRTHVEVLQALPKEGMDEAVEALAEVGVAVVRPVVTRRTVARPDTDRARARLRRWRAVAREAAGLAGRGAPPEVHGPATLDDALGALEPATRVLLCVPDGAVSLARLDPGSSRRFALVVGPEGGLDPAEVERLVSGGAQTVHLGARVLRARLAGAMAASLLLARCGDLDAGPLPAPRPVAAEST